ncbi:MAG: UDP-N-acetylmuramoyl-tripeptide--D-alanyl-D-alanine ligase [Acidobacteriota bacterium]|nr:UDP-N-acetylmuramoyl-tripeptide--D-alanyl-D-alanine ligase [Acidobacteriota bacterium]
MTAAEFASAVDGALEGTGDVVLRGAEVDSRRIEAGDIYVALPGERRDGHEFVAVALITGAAALVREDVDLAPPPSGKALIRVADPLVAHHMLAARERQRRGWRVAAVTGSVGKTTTKDILAALVGRHGPTGSSSGNRNNTLGLPSEMLSQTDAIENFVAEAGMSSPGELAILGEILRPQVLLYTRIAHVHTEFFPDIEGIVRAKAELLPWLDPEGTLIINADDPWQREFPSQTAARVLRYGAQDAEARIDAIEDRGLLGSTFRLVLPGSEARVELPLPGLHQAENLLAAAAAATAFGVTAEQVAATASDLRAPEHRGRILHLAGGYSMVDDSYNASPLAMRRLLELLSRAPGRRVAVLGEMYELGEMAAEAHAQVGREAAASCDVLIAVGSGDASILAEAALGDGLSADAVHLTEDATGATDLLRRLLQEGDVVLVKGSRGVGLDRTVAALVGEEAA